MTVVLESSVIRVSETDVCFCINHRLLNAYSPAIIGSFTVYLIYHIVIA